MTNPRPTLLAGLLLCVSLPAMILNVSAAPLKFAQAETEATEPQAAAEEEKPPAAAPIKIIAPTVPPAVQQAVPPVDVPLEKPAREERRAPREERVKAPVTEEQTVPSAAEDVTPQAQKEKREQRREERREERSQKREESREIERKSAPESMPAAIDKPAAANDNQTPQQISPKSEQPAATPNLQSDTTIQEPVKVPATPKADTSSPAKAVEPSSSAAPAGELPPAPPVPEAKRSEAAPTTFTPGFRSSAPAAATIDDVQRNRRERKIGDRTVIEEPGNRMIVRQNNRTIIRSDESARFAGDDSRVRSNRRDNGTVETVVTRDGVQVFNIVDANGRTLRRYRRDRDGREVNIIDNRNFYQGLAAGAALGIGLSSRPVALPPPRLSIPRDEYIVEYDDASDEDVYETLNAPPVERMSRRYSLDEVRYSPRLRERTRRLDLNAVNFATGSWSISSSQYASLERAAEAINRIIERNPSEVFLIEGHTDAVGSDIDNLSLSDRRAESVARVLSDEFDVPPENLVTQGYGEEFLKIPTQNAERENRRVAVRRITALISKR